MKSIIREKTVYTGISDYIPENIDSFTQMSVNKILTIEDNSRSIDDILKISVAPNITNSKIVKTAIGKSLEGQHLTGYKLLSEGEFFIQINYSCDDEYGGIYIYKDKIYFNNATTLNEDMNQNSRAICNVYIEDIYGDKLSDKEIHLNINFIFTVESY